MSGPEQESAMCLQSEQRKRWEDNIRQWTGLEFGKSQKAVKNREKWRRLVAKSSVVPQRPSRLREKISMMVMMNKQDVEPRQD